MLNSKQQALLVSLWVADDVVFSKTREMLKPEYFDPELRKVVRFIHDYSSEYGGIPTPEIVEAETDFQIRRLRLTTDNQRYTEEQIETFCKQSALKRIIMENSPTLILEERYDELEAQIREAITIKIDRDTGISFFDEFEERQNDPESVAHRYSLGYPDLDRHMDGGVSREEMLLVLAISGGGKSVALLNFGLNLIQQRDPQTGKLLNCLYVSLELPETMIDKRAQMVVARKSSFEVGKYQDEVRERVEALGARSGALIIKKLRNGANANDLRALIKEIEIEYGWVPDILLLDYLDKMHPIQKVSTENIGTRDKFITEEFYDVLGEYRMIGLTASQLVKGAATVEVYDQSHQAGGAEKIRSSDWTLAIHLSDAMRAAGQIGFQLLKTRSSGGVGNTVMLGWDARSLCITNAPQLGGNAVRGQLRSSPGGQETGGNATMAELLSL